MNFFLLFFLFLTFIFLSIKGKLFSTYSGAHCTSHTRRKLEQNAPIASLDTEEISISYVKHVTFRHKLSQFCRQTFADVLLWQTVAALNTACVQLKCLCVCVCVCVCIVQRRGPFTVIEPVCCHASTQNFACSSLVEVIAFPQRKFEVGHCSSR